MTTRNERRAQAERRVTIAHMLGQETWDLAAQVAANGFVMKILRKLQTTELGLDAAIVQVRGFVFSELHNEPLDVELGETPEMRQEIGELFESCLDAAVAHMRERVQTARDLIALVDR